MSQGKMQGRTNCFLTLPHIFDLAWYIYLSVILYQIAFINLYVNKNLPMPIKHIFSATNLITVCDTLWVAVLWHRLLLAWNTHNGYIERYVEKTNLNIISCIALKTRTTSVNWRVSLFLVLLLYKYTQDLWLPFGNNITYEYLIIPK